MGQSSTPFFMYGYIQINVKTGLDPVEPGTYIRPWWNPLEKNLIVFDTIEALVYTLRALKCTGR